MRKKIRYFSFFIIPTLMVLLLWPSATSWAQGDKSGWGDVEIRLNGGTNVAYIGENNIVEIWIENDATLLSMILGLEFDITGVSYQFNPAYGTFGYINPEGNAVGAFNLFHGEIAFMDDFSYDSIVIGAAAIVSGMPASSQSLCYTMQVYIPPDQPEQPGGFCVDNIYIPPSYTWSFVEVGGVSYPPTYNGIGNTNILVPDAPPICFDIVRRPNLPPIIENCPPDPIQGLVDQTITYQFSAYDPDVPPEPLTFTIFPQGSIDATGLFSWHPTIDDVGTWAMTFEASDGLNTTACNFEVEVSSGENIPPVCDPESITSFECLAGDPFTHTFSATDPDNSPLALWYEIVAAPSGIINGASGEFLWETTESDTGMNEIIVSVSDGEDIAECVIYVRVYKDYTYGDANGDGGINVGDAVFLINYVFKGGSSPPSLDAGDANCDYSQNVGDAVFLINYVFKGGPAPGCYIKGACCMFGTCVETTRDTCALMEGEYYGDESSCDDEPTCPSDDCEICCEITITDCPADWLPEGRKYGAPDGSQGNNVGFIATIKAGGPRKIRFFLEGVSTEPGVCINYGKKSETPDLKFIQTANVNNTTYFDAPTDGGMSITTKDAVTIIAVQVTSYDWGAYGKIRACCMNSEGCETYSAWKTIPLDVKPTGGNHIADAWESSHANEAATWDKDWFPLLLKRDGDGFTFYEEYRGTMTGLEIGSVKHQRHDPDHRDLFLHDPDDLHRLSLKWHKFQIMTKFLVHYVNADPVALMNGPGLAAQGHRNINHMSSDIAKIDSQYALHIIKHPLSAKPADWGLTDGLILGPPRSADPLIKVATSQIQADMGYAITAQGGNPNDSHNTEYKDRVRRETSVTTTHEMGHGCNARQPLPGDHVSGVGGRQSRYGNAYSGDTLCVMRYDFDVCDIKNAAHPDMFGIRTAANSPPATTPGRWKFSNYTNDDLSNMIPFANRFCTFDNKCRQSLDVKDD